MGLCREREVVLTVKTRGDSKWQQKTSLNSPPPVGTLKLQRQTEQFPLKKTRSQLSSNFTQGKREKGHIQAGRRETQSRHTATATLAGPHHGEGTRKPSACPWRAKHSYPTSGTPNLEDLHLRDKPPHPKHLALKTNRTHVWTQRAAANWERLVRRREADSPRQGPAQRPRFGKRPDARAHTEHLRGPEAERGCSRRPRGGAGRVRAVPCPAPPHQRAQSGAQVFTGAAQRIPPLIRFYTESKMDYGVTFAKDFLKEDVN